MATRRRAKLPPAMDVRRVEVSTLREDPNNARTHNERNLLALQESLKRFGQQKPIVVTSDMIVRAGNGTLRAAKRLGWTHLDVVVTRIEDVAELRAYAIADNRVSELSDFDDEILAQQLASLNDDGLLAAVGFDDAEVAELTALLGERQTKPPSVGRVPNRSSPSVRVMLSVDQIGEFERALQSTGLWNRAEALLTVCRAYLSMVTTDGETSDREDDADGQFDAALEGANATDGFEGLRQ